MNKIQITVGDTIYEIPVYRVSPFCENWRDVLAECEPSEIIVIQKGVN